MNRIPFLSYRQQIGASLMVIGLAAALLLLSSSDTQTAVALPISVVTDAGQWLEGEPLIHETTNQANAHCTDDPNSFYIIGGRNIDFTGNGPTHDFIQFHANTGEWVELPHVPEGLLASTAVCYEGKIFVVGGEFQGTHNDFYIYHIDENQGSQGYWSEGTPAPRFVKGAALGAWDGKLYLVGGTTQNGEQGYHPVNQVDIYDIASNTWQANAMQQAPFAFSFPGFAQEGPYLYLVGGFSGDYEQNVIVTQRLDMSTGVWTTGPLLNYGRGMVAAELTEQHLYAIGGDANGGGYQDSTDVVEVLDLTYWPFGGWRVLGTPLPEPTMGESSACTDALIEGSIWSTGGDYFDNDGDPDIYNSNLFIPAEPCVNYYYGNLEPEQWSLSGFPGTVVRYTVPLVNDGTQVDYYSVSVSSQWPAFLPVSGVGPVAPGMTGTVQVIVVVPEGPVPVDHDTAILTVTSHGDPSASDSAFLTTHITPVSRWNFDLQPITANRQAAHPGDRLTYKLLISNIGEVADNYSMTITTDWVALTSSNAFTIQPGDSYELLIVVEIPQDANHADWDEAIISLTSRSDPRVSKAVTLTSTAFWHRMLIPLSMKN